MKVLANVLQYYPCDNQKINPGGGNEEESTDLGKRTRFLDSAPVRLF